MINYNIITPSTIINDDIRLSVIAFEKYFSPAISERQNIDEYVLKLSTKAVCIVAKDLERIVGFISFYCNNNTYSYLTFLAVDEIYRGKKIAFTLVQNMIDYAIRYGSKGIDLEMQMDNIKLYQLYHSFNFNIKDKFVGDGGYEKYKLRLRFGSNVIHHFPFQETPITHLASKNDKFGNSYYVKRDDLFTDAQGGNKARKLQYILKVATSNGYTAVVTAGDINSNHNRATALMCAKLGLKLKVVVHNDFPENECNSLNLYIIRLAGAEVIYCSKHDVKEVMDKAMSDYNLSGEKPYYIYGGGHCLEGSYAYYEAVANIKTQIDWAPNYLFFASGTGTTHAGLHRGFKDFFPNTQVIGISIARNADRGVQEIYKSIKELENYLGSNDPINIQEIQFDDSYVGGGYEHIMGGVKETIKKIALSEGLLLDPTYTGKAYYGMQELIIREQLTYKKILFWNTGGIYNLLSTNRNIFNV